MIRALSTLALLATPSLAQVIHVDASAGGAGTGATWSDAFVDLQQGLAAAAPGDEVWVAAGAYRPAAPGGSNSASFVLGAGVTLYGGFAGTEATLADRAGLFGSTILSGDLDGDDLPGFLNLGDNSYHVLRATAPGAVLDGFTVSGGNADGGGPIDPNGGGIYVSADVTVRHTTFVGNRADRGGGAVYVDGGATAVFEDCSFSSNRADNDGGACVVWQGEASFVDSLLQDNSCGDDGGAILVNDTVSLSGCELRGNQAENSGGGIYSPGGRVNAVGCRFYDCSSAAGGQGGGLHSNQGDGTLSSVVFQACSAGLGGGLYNVGSGGGVLLTVDNATFYANQSTDPLGGAGIYSTQTGFRLRNVILWENVGGGGTDFAAQIAGASFAADYSCIQSMSAGQAAILGTGNILDAPLFADPDGDDDIPGTLDDHLRLSVDSPCIDSGDNAASAGVEFDVEGWPRRVDDPAVVDAGTGGGPVIDLGAHEHHSLWANQTEFSLAAGGAFFLIAQLGADVAGDFYIVVGSASGTFPGLALGGQTLPLNPDPYFALTLNQPNQPPLVNSFGALGVSGGAATTFTLPPGMDPVLAGLEVHHALAVLDPATFLPTLTTTPFPLELVP